MKAILRGLAIALVCLALVTVRVIVSSRASWKTAESSTGDEKIYALGRAARMYAPGNPWSRRALEALAGEGRAGGPDALAAWREARSAILATRSAYTHDRALLDEANGHIAQLMAQAEPESRGPLAERQAWHARRLAADEVEVQRRVGHGSLMRGPAPRRRARARGRRPPRTGARAAPASDRARRRRAR